MNSRAKKFLWMILPCFSLLFSGQALAKEEKPAVPVSSHEQKETVKAPDLVEIIPAVKQLSVRLGRMNERLSSLSKELSVQEEYVVLEAKMRESSVLLQELRNAEEEKLRPLLRLKRVLDADRETYQTVTGPLRNAISELGAWREEWRANRDGLEGWRSSIPEQGALPRLQKAFSRAEVTINEALAIIHKQLDHFLAVQEKGTQVEANIKTLLKRVDDLASSKRQQALLDASPPLLSMRYFAQFEGGLWGETRKGLVDFVGPNKNFFDQHGWILFLQIFLTLVAAIAFYVNRKALQASGHWSFLSARPISAAFFMSTVATILPYQYKGFPTGWGLVIVILASFSLARLLGSILEVAWKRQLAYGVVGTFAVLRLMDIINFPPPLFRLYLVLTGLTGLVFCVLWIRESRRLKDPHFYTGLLYATAGLLVIFVTVEFWGNAREVEDFFARALRSVVVFLAYWFFIHTLIAGLKWFLYNSPLAPESLKHGEKDAPIRRALSFIDGMLWVLAVPPALLDIWGDYDSINEAMGSFLSMGFSLGALKLDVGMMIGSIGVLGGSYVLSLMLQTLFMEKLLFRSRVERGVRHSISQLTHYVFIVLGFMVAISMMGFEITKLTMIVSALGVGIGFGLQGVVNNFVSGLILLFERPVRLGDNIELGGKWAVIKHIGLRATVVRTFDHADLIIPNADLVNNQVTNWTLSNRQVRAIIPVGVAYGSDVPKVIETLLACARTQKNVTEFPSPQALFLGFGESSLDFDLRVWVRDADDRLQTISDLHQEVDRQFREANISIAFPQRDLHLRSVDPTAAEQVSKMK